MFHLPTSARASALQRLLALIASLFTLCGASAQPPLFDLDSDGDGQADVAEWFTGADAANTRDTLRVDDLQLLQNPARLRLAWRSIPGRIYTVERTSNLPSAPGGQIWQALGEVTAAGASTSFETPVPQGTTHFFRVTTPFDRSRSPFITPLEAEQPSLLEAGVVRFTVQAYHPDGLADVKITDGERTLGAATEREGHTWEFHWFANDLDNGTHQLKATATATSGLVRDSSALSFLVSIAQAQRTLGRLSLRANQLSEENGVLTLEGGLSFGGAFLQGQTALATLDLATQTLTGHGALHVPGLGAVISGTWEADASTGWTKPGVGAVTSPLVLNSRTQLDVASLQLNLATGELRGHGSLRHQPLDGGPEVRVNGAFSVMEGATGVSLAGSHFGAPLAGEGRLTVQLATNELAWNGSLQLPAGVGGPARSFPSALVSGAQQWQLEAPGDRGDVLQDRSFRAVALNAQPQYLLDYPDQFARLGADGAPLELAPLIADAQGRLPAFEYRPMGRQTAGSAAALALRFPQGATILQQAGEWLLEFQQVELASGANSILQLDAPLRSVNSAARRLPLGSLSIAQISTLFDLGDAGLDLHLFGKIPFTLNSGELSQAGFTQLRAALKSAGVPQKWNSGLGFGLDLSDPRRIVVPYSGQLPLGKVVDGAPRISVPATQPLLLALESSGKVTAQGRVDVDFPDGGPAFTGTFDLNEPRFAFTMAAKNVDVPFASSLAGQLPQVSVTNLDVASTGPALDAATLKLKSLQKSYLNFSLSFTSGNLGLRPIELPGKIMGAIDAWAQARLANPSIALPPEAAKAVETAARNASASRGLKAATEVWIALKRLGLGNPALPSLPGAKEEAEAAVERRAEEPGQGLTIAEFHDVLRIILEYWDDQLRVGAPLPPGAMGTNLAARFNEVLATTAAEYGVKSGLFDLAQTPKIRALGHFETHQLLADLLSMTQKAQLLGIDGDVNGLQDEFYTLLANHLHAVLKERLDRAKMEQHALDFLIAAEDYLDLHMWEQLGLLPDNSHIVTLHPIQMIVADLDALNQADQQRNPGLRPVHKDGAELARLMRILQKVPPQITFAAAPIQRAYDRMTGTIGRGLSWLGGGQARELDSLELRVAWFCVRLIESGIAHAQIRDRFSFPAGAPAWESAQRLSAAVDALATRGRSERDMGSLSQGYEVLLKEAERLAKLPTPDQVRRKLYLTEAQKLLAAMRATALDMHSNSVLGQLADLLLPGEIHVDEAAGVLEFNTASKGVRGSFSGKVRLPDFGLALTLESASFHSRGEFDLTAHGTVLLPDAANGLVRFSVTPRHPLQISYRKPNRISLAGGGMIEVNGLSAEAWIKLDDPKYAFGFSAKGARLDLASKLRVMIPALPPNGAAFPAAASRDLNAYFRSMAANFDSLSSLTEAPAVREPGQAPEFGIAYEASPFAAIESWANSEIADARLGLQRSYSESLQSAREQLNSASDYFKLKANALDARQLAAAIRLIDAVEQALEKKRARGETNPEQTLEPEIVRLRAGVRDYVLRLFAVTDGMLDIETENALFAAAARVTTSAKLNDPPPPGAAAVIEAWSAYHKRTAAPRLQSFYISPRDGAPTEPLTFEDLPKAQVQQALVNLSARRIITARTADFTVEGSAMQWPQLAEKAQVRLLLKYRDDCVKNLIIADPEAPEAQTESGARETARAISLNTRELYLFHYQWQMLGLSAPSDVPVVKFDGTRSEFSDLEEADIRNIRYFQLLTLEQKKPLRIDKRARVSFGGKMVDIELWSLPRMEGFHNLDTHYKEFSYRKFNKGSIPFEYFHAPESPTEQELYREYIAASRGLYDSGQLDSNSIDALVLRIKGEVELFVLRPTLRESQRIAQNLAVTLLLAERAGLPSQVSELKVDLSRFQTALLAAAAAQKAWWYVSEYTEILTDAADTYAGDARTTLADFFESSATASLEGAFALLNDLALLLPGQRPFDLKLPGDLEVRSVFGEIEFNRQTREFGGSFGGKIVFPENDMYFEIVNASLHSDGRFSIEAGLASPLPIGGLKTTANVSASGQFRLSSVQGQPPVTLQQFALNGTGTLYLPEGGSLVTTVSYDTATRVLAFTATGEELGLKFGQHFALLSGQAAFQLGGVGGAAFPSNGEFSVGGTVGMLRNEKPAQNPQRPSPEDFHLVSEDLTLRFAFQPDRFTVELPQGALLLPEMFSSPAAQPGGQPLRGRLTVAPDDKPRIVFHLEQQGGNQPPLLSQVVFDGALDFSNVGLKISGFDEITASGFRGRLDFGSLTLAPNVGITAAEAPALRIASGLIKLPHPAGDPDVELALSDVFWKLDGFPSGTLQLANNVRLFDVGGFSMTVLGDPSTLTTGVKILPTDGLETLPVLQFFGGVEMRIAASVLHKEPGSGDPVRPGTPENEFGAAADGSLTLYPDGRLPRLEWTRAAVSGSFRLGGSNGVSISGVTPGTPARLEFRGIHNLFSQSVENPFEIMLTGMVRVPDGPGLGLENCRFVFTKNWDPPKFEPGTLAYSGQGWAIAESGVLNITKASITFEDGGLPIPQLFHPTNIKIKGSFRVGLPSLEAPMLAGGADDLQVTFTDDGLPVLGLDGLAFELDLGSEFPPIEELGGKLYIGGLSNPANLIFAGKLGGSMQGYKVTVLAAFSTKGMLGMCAELNAGSVGIPLGPTGFLFTGASAGYSTLNRANDPCDFSEYAGYQVDGLFGPVAGAVAPDRPPASWDEVRKSVQRMIDAAPVFTLQGVNPLLTGSSNEALSGSSDDAATEIQCPTRVPPPTVNILCMPHPNQTRFPGRIIVKFTSIDEPDLNNRFGITRELIRDLFSQAGSDAEKAARLAVEAALRIRTQLEAELPRPDPVIMGQMAADSFDTLMADIEDGFKSAFEAGINGMPGEKSADSLYDLIKEYAYRGLDSIDVTYTVSGTFSYTGISSFASVTGKGTISTTGAVGVTGYVNLLGIPVGEGKLFLAITDENGDPNPSLAGQINVALGPIEFGTLTAQLDTKGSVTGVLEVFGEFASALGEDLVQELLAEMDEEFAGGTLESILAGMGPLQSDAFKIAFLGHVVQLPPARLPAGFRDRVRQLLADAMEAYDPEFVMCGAMGVKAFGLSLGGSLFDVKLRLNKRGYEGFVQGSPSAMLLATALGVFSSGTGALVSLFGGPDIAYYSFAAPFPDVAQTLLAGFDGKFSDIHEMEAYAREQSRTLLENATYTAGYELMPLGMSIARANMRIVNPDLTDHPVVRSTPWVRPEDRGESLPSRVDVLKAAVSEPQSGTPLLGDIFWKGAVGEMQDLFPGDTQKQEAVKDLSLTHDYFPHGGVLMAARMQVPKIIGTLPREEWATLINQGAEPLQRLDALKDIIDNYILEMEERGSFTAYLPAPNPPVFYNDQGERLVPPPSVDPYDLFASLRSFDPEKIRMGDIYPGHHWFCFANLSGQLLDVPLGEVQLAIQPPDGNLPARFEATLVLPEESWLRPIVGAADIRASITGAPQVLIEDAFTELRADAEALSNPRPEDLQPLLDDFLGKMSVEFPRTEIRASVNAPAIPAELQQLLQIEQGASAELYAYSPGFAQNLPEGAPAWEQLKKTGGIGLWTRAKFTNLFSADAFLTLQLNEAGTPRITAKVNAQDVLLPFGARVNLNGNFDSQPAGGLPALSVTGNVTGEFTVSALGWPVSIPGNASVTITDHTARFIYASGGSNTVVTADFSDPGNPVYSFSGRLEIDPLVNGLIRVEPQDNPNGKLVLEVDGESATINGVRVVVGGPFNRSTVISQLTVDKYLNFQPVQIGPVSASFSGYTVSSLLWKIERIDGVLAVRDAQWTWVIPGSNNRTLTVGPGSVDSNGNFSLQASASGSFSLSAVPWPVTVPADASVLVANNVTKYTFQSGGAQAELTSTYAAGAPSSHHFKGRLEIAPIENSAVGNVIRIASPAGGNLFVDVDGSSGTLSGAQVTVGGAFGQIVDLPSFSIDSNFNFAPVQIGPMAAAASGYQVGSLTWSVRRVLGVLVVEIINWSWTPPNSSGASLQASGFVATNGSINIGGTLSGELTIPALLWPVKVPASSSVNIQNEVTTYSFTSGGANASLTSTYPPGGIPIHNFVGAIDIDPLVTGIISIKPRTGAKLRIAINGTRGTVSPAKVEVGGLFGQSASIPQAVNIPEFDVDSSFNFFEPYTIPSIGGVIAGYAVADLRWTVNRVNGALSITNVRCSLSVPGFDSVSVSFGSGITVNATTGAFSFSGLLPDLATGIMRIKSASGGSLSPVFSSASGLSLSDARLEFGELATPVTIATSAAPFVIPASGNFSRSASGSITVRGYPLTNGSFTFQRVAGVTSLQVNSSTYSLLNGGPTLSAFSGSIASDGSVSLQQNYSGGFYGFPIGSANIRLATTNQGPQQRILDDGAQAFWKLDETVAGAPVTDWTLNNHDGAAVASPTLRQSPARPGSFVSYRFNGSSQYVTVPHHANLNAGNALTVEAWVRTNGLFSSGESWDAVVTKGDSAWRLHRLSNTRFIAFGTTSTTGAADDLASSVAIDDGRWHHIVAVLDGGVKRLYVDGQLNAERQWAHTLASNSEPVMIGSNSQQANRHFNGWVDEVAFYRRALAPGDVEARFRTGQPHAWWRLDETLLPLIGQPLAQDATFNHHAYVQDTAPGLNNPPALYSGEGGSFYFNGSTHALNVPHSVRLNGTGGITVSAWVKLDKAFTSDWQAIVTKGDSAWRISRYSNTNRLSFDTTSSSGAHSLPSSSSVNDEKWHHVVAVYDGQTKQLYIGGIMEASASWSGLATNTQPVRIGANSEAAGRNWKGWIDDVMIHGQALNPQEVAELYSGGNGARLSFDGYAQLYTSPYAPWQPQYRPAVHPWFRGAITSRGTFDLALVSSGDATLFGFGFSNLDLRFFRQVAPPFALMTGQATLNSLPNSPISINPAFGIEFTHSNGSTSASLSASNLSLSIGGYAFNPNLSMWISGSLGSAPPITWANATFVNSTLASLNLPALSGTLNSSGEFSVPEFSRSITLRGFTAASAKVNFNSSQGLHVNGSVELMVRPSGDPERDFGDVIFSGTLSPSGSYTLTGSGQLQFGTFVTNSFAMRLSSAGDAIMPVAVIPELSFGNLKVPVTNLTLNSTGIGYAMKKTLSRTDYFLRGVDPDFVTRDHLKVTFTTAVSLSYSFSSGALSGNLGAGSTWAWEVINFNPPPPPAPQPPMSGSFNISGGIGSNGEFTVNSTSAASGFKAPPWPDPPPGWSWGFVTSQFYDLW